VDNINYPNNKRKEVERMRYVIELLEFLAVGVMVYIAFGIVALYCW
jgi:hypothetical protein